MTKARVGGACHCSPKGFWNAASAILTPGLSVYNFFLLKGAVEKNIKNMFGRKTLSFLKSNFGSNV
jgi:hypothetical protein